MVHLINHERSKLSCRCRTNAASMFPGLNLKLQPKKNKIVTIADNTTKRTRISKDALIAKGNVWKNHLQKVIPYITTDLEALCETVALYCYTEQSVSDYSWHCTVVSTSSHTHNLANVLFSCTFSSKGFF